jgi:nucleotide-binding universal stress UspA family protein
LQNAVMILTFLKVEQAVRTELAAKEPRMIKDIVVNLALEIERDAAAEFALSVASAFRAHAAGIAFQYDPIMPAAMMDDIPPDVIDMQRADNQRAANAATSRFDGVARAGSVLSETRIVESSMAGVATRFAQIARRFDLSIVAQAKPEAYGPEALIIEHALFDSGRPVLVVPYIQTAPFKAERVLLCWDGGRPAARAAADAMPFLSRAKTVEVFIVESGKLQSDEIPGADIAEHLARHNCNVSITRTASGDTDVASVILSHAADTSADMLVMGGYGHSRLREFILGGATRAILSSMTLPTLMSH